MYKVFMLNTNYDPSFEKHLHALLTGKVVVLDKDSGSILKSYDKGALGSLQAFFSSLSFNSSGKNVVYGDKAKEIIVDDCKLEIKSINKLVSEINNFEKLSTLPPKEFESEIDRVKAKFKTVDNNFIRLCLTNETALNQLFANDNISPDLNALKIIYSYRDLNTKVDRLIEIKGLLSSLAIEDAAQLMPLLEKLDKETTTKLKLAISRMIASHFKEQNLVLSTQIPHIRPLMDIADLYGLNFSAFLDQSGLNPLYCKAFSEEALTAEIEDLNRNLDNAYDSIAQRKLKIEQLKSKLYAIDLAWPGGRPQYITSSINRLIDLESSLALRLQLFQWNKLTKEVSLVQPTLAHNLPEKDDAILFAHSPPNRDYKAEQALQFIIEKSKEWLIFDLNDKNNEKFRKEFENLLADIKAPPTPMTKEWCRARIDEIESLTKNTTIEKFAVVSESLAALNAYSKRLDNLPQLLTYLDEIVDLFKVDTNPKSSENTNSDTFSQQTRKLEAILGLAEQNNIEVRSNSIVNQMINKFNGTIISNKNDLTKLTTKLNEAMQRLNEIVMLGIIDPKIMVHAIKRIEDMQNKIAAANQIYALLKKPASYMDLPMDAYLQEAFVQFFAELKIPQQASQLRHFIENIQLLRETIGHIQYLSNDSASIKIRLEQIAFQAYDDAMKIDSTKLAIKSNLANVVNAPSNSIDEINQLNIKTMTAIIEALLFPPEGHSWDFRARLIHMQEVASSFRYTPGIERHLQLLDAAIINFRAAEQALSMLEGNEVEPNSIRRFFQDDPSFPFFQDDPSFPLVKKIIGESINEQISINQQAIDKIKSEVTHYSIDLLRERTLKMEGLLRAIHEFPHLIDDHPLFTQTIRLQQQEFVNFQSFLIDLVFAKLELTSDQLLSNIKQLPTLLPLDLLDLNVIIEELIHRTLQNIRVGSAYNSLLNRKNFLEHFVHLNFTGSLTAYQHSVKEIFLSQIENHRLALEKLDGFFKDPIEVTRSILQNLNTYPAETELALGDAINTLLNDIKENPGHSVQKLEESLALLTQLEEKLDQDIFADLRTFSQTIKKDLQTTINMFKELDNIFKTIKSSNGTQKLETIQQFVDDFYPRLGMLGKFPHLQQVYFDICYNELKKDLKLIKHHIQIDLTRVCGKDISLTETQEIFENAHLYANVYTHFLGQFPKSGKKLTSAAAKLQAFLTDVNNIKNQMDSKQQSLLGKRQEVEEKLQAAESIAKNYSELQIVFDAAKNADGELPLCLVQNISLNSHEIPSAELLENEAVKMNCLLNIDIITLNQTKILEESERLELELSTFQNQHLKLIQQLDIQAQIEPIIPSEYAGLGAESKFSKSFWENLYLEKVSNWNSDHNITTSIFANPVFFWLRTQGEAIINEIHNIKITKKEELDNLENSMGYESKISPEIRAIGNIIDKFSSINEKEQKFLGQIEELQREMTDDEERLLKLKTQYQSNLKSLNQLQNFAKAIKMANSKVEDNRSVIQSFEIAIANNFNLEMERQHLENELNALQYAKKLIQEIANQKMMVERCSTLITAVNYLKKIVSYVEKEPRPADWEEVYSDLIKIRKIYGQDPLFIKLINPQLVQRLKVLEDILEHANEG